MPLLPEASTYSSSATPLGGFVDEATLTVPSSHYLTQCRFDETEENL